MSRRAATATRCRCGRGRSPPSRAHAFRCDARTARRGSRDRLRCRSGSAQNAGDRRTPGRATPTPPARAGSRSRRSASTPRRRRLRARIARLPARARGARRARCTRARSWSSSCSSPRASGSTVASGRWYHSTPCSPWTLRPSIHNVDSAAVAQIRSTRRPAHAAGTLAPHPKPVRRPERAVALPRHRGPVGETLRFVVGDPVDRARDEQLVGRDRCGSDRRLQACRDLGQPLAGVLGVADHLGRSTRAAGRSSR